MNYTLTSSQIVQIERDIKPVTDDVKLPKQPVKIAKAPDGYKPGWYVHPTMTPGDGQPPSISFKPGQEDAARMCLAMCPNGGSLYEVREDGHWWRYFCD